MSANDLKDTKKLQAGFVTPASNTNPLADPAHNDYQIHERIVTDEISERAFQYVSLCNQCGKCSAGCPVRYYKIQNLLINFPGFPKYFGRVREDFFIQEKNLNSLRLKNM